jgi:hypothetical protein
MLHLSLAGNLLSALGGSLDLYKVGVVPEYPGRVLVDNIPMTLRALDAESLGYFIEVRMLRCSRPNFCLHYLCRNLHQIEGPDDRRLQNRQVTMNVAPGYRSIGELYENVLTGHHQSSPFASLC